MKAKMASDETPLSSRVLEYYREHSKTRELQKYFCGDVNEEVNEANKENKGNEINDINEINELNETNDSNEDHREPSPTSSVTSNRKLEWDNGADIGYHNASRARVTNMQKSVSLSALPSGHEAEAKIASVMSYLKGKVGVPMAESTPKTKEVEELFVSPHFEPSSKLTSKLGIYEIIEEAEKKLSKENRNRVLETSVFNYEIKPESGETCAVESSGNESEDVNVLKYRNKKMLHLGVGETKYFDVAPTVNHDAQLQTSFENVAVGIQTDTKSSSALSFEFYKAGSACVSTSVSNSASNSASTSTSVASVPARVSTSAQVMTSARVLAASPRSASTPPEATPPLAQISSLTSTSGSSVLSKQHSNELISDVEKSIQLMSRLIKSKRYSEQAKERYISKIVKKMLKTEYEDDLIATPNLTCESQPQQTVKVKDPRFTLPKHLDLISPPVKNWKDDKTLSERLLEKNSTGDSNDHLLTFASKERHNQIEWIENEIKHLSKLKGLLERNSDFKPTAAKSTAVYTITTERDKACGSNRVYVERTCGLSKKCSKIDFQTSESERSCSCCGKYPRSASSVVVEINKTVHVRKKDCKSDEMIDKEKVDKEKDVRVDVCGDVACGSGYGSQNEELLKQLCLNKAKVVSSTITNSTDNPEDNVRRLVIEVPIEKELPGKKPDKKGVVIGTRSGGPSPVECDRRSPIDTVHFQSSDDECCSTEKKHSPIDKNVGGIGTVDSNASSRNRTDRKQRSPIDKNIGSIGTVDSRASSEAECCSTERKHKNIGSIAAVDSNASSCQSNRTNRKQRLLNDKNVNIDKVDSRTSSCRERSPAARVHKQYEPIDTTGDSIGTFDSHVSSCRQRSPTRNQRSQKDKCTKAKSSQSERKSPELDDRSAQCDRSALPQTDYSDHSCAPRLVQAPVSKSKGVTIEDVPDDESDEVEMIEVKKPTPFGDKGVQTDKEKRNKKLYADTTSCCESSSVTSTSTTSDSSGSVVLCSCCRKRLEPDEVRRGSKQSKTSNRCKPVNSATSTPSAAPCNPTSRFKPMATPGLTNPTFCGTCFNGAQNYNPQNPFFTQPQHQCNCYTLVNSETMEMIRTTLLELQNLDECRCKETGSSKCVCKGKKKKQGHGQSQGQGQGQGQSQSQSQGQGQSQGGQGQAQSQAHSQPQSQFQNQAPTQFQFGSQALTQYKAQPEVQERPATAYYLTFEQSNKQKLSESAKNLDKSPKIRSLEEVRVKLPVDHPSHYDDKSKRHKKRKHKKSLQEYLESNRPNFIQGAEERRKCLLELAYMREQRCQKYKQLLALTNGIPIQNPGYNETHKKRIFTTKEMKSMTAKNYKKLPEVQQKLLDRRDGQIKKANRLLADIFNKKLREKVLRGNPSLSTSISVINLT